MSGRVCSVYGSSLEQERINVSFRWIRQHVASCFSFRTGAACCLPTCAHSSSAAVTELVESCVWGGFWVLLGALCMWVYLLCQSTPSCVQGSGCAGVPVAGHALGRGRWGHYLRDTREFTGLHKSALYVSRMMEAIPFVYCRVC